MSLGFKNTPVTLIGNIWCLPKNNDKSNLQNVWMNAKKKRASL
jgi:hypothetical protein